ncbi:MAG: Lar family restriction alleviation protein [Ruminococcus sp.]|nr:Lar family restriction alleviation protein [Ruminococcus sp.]
MDNKLKPCPFCGCNNIKVDLPLDFTGLYYCICNGCRASTAIFSSREQAMKAWNRRTKNA